MSKTQENIPSVLSFEKKIAPSDGFMRGTTWEQLKSSEDLQIIEKTIRGTLNKVKKATEEKEDDNLANANIQTIDNCSLKNHQDTLEVSFTVKILGNLKTPSTCNNLNFLTLYQENLQKYTETTGFEEIAKRYAINLANARFLWRNRVGAEKISVHIEEAMNEDNKSKLSLEFDAKSVPLNNFETPNISNTELLNLKRLTERIKETLQSTDHYLLLNIKAYAKIGNAQDVYPSQEFIINDSNVYQKNHEKSKILYQRDGIASIHSQKIGNAIRTIDTWYDSEDYSQPISIEQYGAVTVLGKAFRAPKTKKDFDNLFEKFINQYGDLKIEEKHYVIAMLVRGGVFGQAKGNESKEKEE